jgi:AraC family transcriptional regulator
VPNATIQLIRFEMTEPSDNVFHERERFYLDLCLTPRPRNARARFRNHWALNRFEPLGDVFMFPSGEAVHARGDSTGPQVSIVCDLHADALREWSDGEIDWNDHSLKASLNIPQASIRSLMLRLAEESRSPGFASETLMELIAAQLGIELSRYCRDAQADPVAGGLASWCLRLIDERLIEVSKPPGLAELAGLCGLSVRQLTRGFRASRGCSIGNYIEQSRIGNAKRFLALDESVKSIAFSMGFSSSSAFSQAFRRATGETPRQFRQRLRH